MTTKNIGSVIAVGIATSVLSLSLVSAMEMNDQVGVPMKKDTMMMKDDMKKGENVMDDSMKKNMMMATDTMMYEKISPSSPKEDITKIQMALVKKGHLTMPQGTPFGYYGPLTKAAYTQYTRVSMMDNNMKKSDTIISDTMSTYETITPTSNSADIAKLQMKLVEKGHLMMPQGVPFGYYGPMTKAAYAKYTMTSGMKESGTMQKADTMMR